MGRCGGGVSREKLEKYLEHAHKAIMMQNMIGSFPELVSVLLIGHTDLFRRILGTGWFS